jgi:hypothetical protein
LVIHHRADVYGLISRIEEVIVASRCVVRYSKAWRRKEAPTVGTAD